MKELREGHEATVNLLELVQRGKWPDENSKPLATYICRDLERILEQGISGPTAGSYWQSLSSTRYDEEMGTPKLESLVEKGTWPGEDSKPYARLLCAYINRALELCGTNHALSEGVTGEKRPLDAERDVSLSSAAKFQKAARKEPRGDASSSGPAKSKKIARKKPEEISWTAFENGMDFDGFTWNKYGRKKIKGQQYERDYYRCISEDCPAKKKMQRTDEAGGFEVCYMGRHTCKGPAPASGSGLNLVLTHPNQNAHDDNEINWEPYLNDSGPFSIILP